MAIRSIGAKALQQNKSDWAVEAEPNTVATNSSDNAEAGSVTINTSTEPSPAIRNLRRWLAAGCLGLIVVGSSGCTMTAGIGRQLKHTECIDDFMIGYRNRALAEKAWHCRKDQFCNQRNEREFRDGFMKGYMEVAEGGNACTPAIAPSQYWGWRYQSANGQGAVNAWFQGFPQGARAAEEDGVGHWSQIGTSSAPQQAPVPMPAAAYSNSDSSSTAPAPANPFYTENEKAPEPTKLDEPKLDKSGIEPIESDATEAIDALDDFDSAYQSSDSFPFAAVLSDGPAAASQPDMRTAVIDRSNVIDESVTVDIDDVFGTSSDTINISDANDLPFSFE
ncbi:hypothetical protein Poly51_33280 [Rubripirellula tenax]|uniref:Uncharacterized protein n=1 Tax=Rubripirellula tenax TaxID=2528015 RepID=A0A5C6F482_9BACT|nr:hypothetical protein [Rubripirellula tenax]TWU54609.1 hypothetical protein Poly51_33280 [Rubripirellula tenax]